MMSTPGGVVSTVLGITDHTYFTGHQRRVLRDEDMKPPPRREVPRVLERREPPQQQRQHRISVMTLKIVTMTMTIPPMMVSRRPAIAEMIELMARPMAEMMEPIVV